MDRVSVVALALAAIAVAIAVLEGFEARELTSSLSSSLSTSIASLSASMSSSYEALSRSVSRLSGELSSVSSAVRAASRSLSSSIAFVSSSVARLGSEVSTLSRGLESLSASVSALGRELGSRVSRLEASVSALSSVAKSVREELSRVSSVASRNSASIEHLEKELSALSEGLSVVNSSVKLVSENLRELASSVSDLRSRVEGLSEEVSKLSQNLSRLRSVVFGELKKLVNAVTYADQWHLALASRNYTFVQELLRTVANESVVREVVSEVGIWGDAIDRAIKAFKFIELNLSYCRDPYSYIPTASGGIILSRDLIELPNATIARECGDCEDLALLAYALMKVGERPGEKLFLVAVWWGKKGHVALLVIGEKWVVILDPAGDWLNGVSTWLRIGEGENAIWLPPLALDPELKRFLLDEGLASVVYVNASTGEETMYVYKLSPWRLVEEWIRYWGSVPTEIDVYGESTYREFHSVASFVEWIESELSS